MFYCFLNPFPGRAVETKEKLGGENDLTNKVNKVNKEATDHPDIENGNLSDINKAFTTSDSDSVDHYDENKILVEPKTMNTKTSDAEHSSALNKTNREPALSQVTSGSKSGVCNIAESPLGSMSKHTSYKTRSLRKGGTFL